MMFNNASTDRAQIQELIINAELADSAHAAALQKGQQ